MHQERNYPGRVMATDLVNPDFAAFARSFGAYGERVESTDAFAAALERALASGGPALLELVCDPEALTPRQSLSAARAQGETQRGALSGDALHTLPARRIAAAVTRGELSAEEVTRHHLDRIEEHAHLNTVITLTREQRARARAGEPRRRRWPACRCSSRTSSTRPACARRYGSRIFRDNVPLRSATSVRRLLDAGAIMLGKANLHEFAWGVTSRNRAYGAVVNSARPDRIPGGSSGGNASALAAGPVRARARHRHRARRSACRPPPAAWPASSPRSAACRPTASGRSRPRSTTSGRSRAASTTARSPSASCAARRSPSATRPACACGSSMPRRSTPTTEAFLAAAGLPAAPALVRLHLAEAAEVHREIYASHRDAYDDDLHAKMAVGLAVSPARARGARERAARLARGVRERVRLGRARLARRTPAICPPPTCPMTIELTDRMTAYTRPVNWLGWPSAVTADGVMHTALDEAVLLAHASAWEA